MRTTEMFGFQIPFPGTSWENDALGVKVKINKKLKKILEIKERAIIMDRCPGPDLDPGPCLLSENLQLKAQKFAANMNIVVKRK